MVAVVGALFRPVSVNVAITRRIFAYHRRALNVILQHEQEEACAVCRWLRPGAGVLCG